MSGWTVTSQVGLTSGVGDRVRGRLSENSQVMGAITPNQPISVAGVGRHHQQQVIDAHRLPHRGSGIPFSDNLVANHSPPAAGASGPFVVVGPVRSDASRQPNAIARTGPVEAALVAECRTRPTGLTIGPDDRMPSGLPRSRLGMGDQQGSERGLGPALASPRVHRPGPHQPAHRVALAGSGDRAIGSWRSAPDRQRTC